MVRPDPLDVHRRTRDPLVSPGSLALALTALVLIAAAAFRAPPAVLLGVAASAAGLLALLRLLERHGREVTALTRRLEEAQDEADKVRQQLERQEKLTSLGMLAAGVAHEINNPMSYVLANVSGLADELRRCAGLPPALRGYADEVLPETMDGIRRVNAIVADLRAFSREDPGPFTAFDVNEEVRTAIRITGAQLGAKAELSVALGKLPDAFGKPRQITQVLVNLLVNAAQAIPVRGTIAVATRCDPDELLIEVRDSGVGMTPDVMARLFQPFFTTKPVGLGTGLGLAVAHGIVRRHGGRIAVESAHGEGTTVTVHLPRPRPRRGELRVTHAGARLENEPIGAAASA